MTTELIRSLYNVNHAHYGAVATIGNFDGVHLGHQQLVKEVIQEATLRDLPSMIITFEPHPYEYFAKENITIPRLTRLREKFQLLAKTSVDYVLMLPFNQQLAELPAHHFTQVILKQQLKLSHLIVGDDFRFGYKRAGDFVLLKTEGERLHFSVEAMPTFTILGERVSSTRVRKALGVGDHQLVKTLLGRPYSMLGKVRRGDQLGRQWGFPTANIFLHRRLTPVHGIYTVLVHGISSKPLPGAANVGSRPTVDGTKTLLEVHLLDFNQDIYGKAVEVEFCTKLRDEEHFENIDLLREQITKDVAMTRNFFEKQGVI